MEMVNVGSYAHKHTSYATGRRFNIWYLVMRCPECGAEKHPPRNTSRGKKYMCDNCKAAQQSMHLTAFSVGMQSSNPLQASMFAEVSPAISSGR